MLTNCNQLSINRLKTAGNEFKKHTALLVEMKRDLDYIFKRIRIVKNKLSQQYPQAFNGKFNGVLVLTELQYYENYDMWYFNYDMCSILIWYLLTNVEAVRSSLAEEVIVEDVDCPVKPLEPEIVPLPSASHTVTDRDPDSDGNQTCSTSNRITVQ